MELASLSKGAGKKVEATDDFSFLDDLEAREQRFRPGKREQMHTTDSVASTAQADATSSSPSRLNASSGWKKGFFSGPKPRSCTSQIEAEVLTSKFKKSDIPTSSVPLNVEILRPESEAVQPEKHEPSQNLAFTAQVRERKNDRSIERGESSTLPCSSEAEDKEKEASQKPLSIFAQQRLKMKDTRI